MMEANKKLGIYLDHAAAQLIEFSDRSKKARTILLDFKLQDKHETLQRSESAMHNKEQDRQRAYFKMLSGPISGFDEVLLFGPTEAKTELLHFLRKEPKFHKIDIELRTTDKLTPVQQHAFVRDFYKKFDVRIL